MTMRRIEFKCPYCGVEQFHNIDTSITRHVLLCDIDNTSGCDLWFVCHIEVKIEANTFALVDPQMKRDTPASEELVSCDGCGEIMTNQDWTPIGVIWPYQNKTLLFLCKNSVRYGYYNTKGWWAKDRASGFCLVSQKDVTHWMWLP